MLHVGQTKIDYLRQSADILSPLKFSQTGISGLDKMLGNRGIPAGYSVSIIGAPGAGKTTLAMQFLYNGIKLFKERGLYVSLDEDITRLRDAMLSVGIDLRSLRGKTLSFIDATQLRSVPSKLEVGGYDVKREEFSLLSLMESIRNKVVEAKVKRIVIDPLAMLTVLFPNESERRMAVADLIQHLSTLGATTLLLTELPSDAPIRTYQIEDYLSQGAIIMTCTKLTRVG
jgi:KaiC/GvpD/RAD55 family RecA-like ATPase